MGILLAALLAASGAPPKTVKLSFRCSPAAHVHVLWPGGKGACETPCSLKVPVKTPVQVTFSAAGYLNYTENFLTTRDRLVDGVLPMDAPF